MPRGSLVAAKVATLFDLCALQRCGQRLSVFAVVFLKVPSQFSLGEKPQLTTGTLLYVTHRLIPSSQTPHLVSTSFGPSGRAERPGHPATNDPF
jgi:hypothetical protein